MKTPLVAAVSARRMALPLGLILVTEDDEWGGDGDAVGAPGATTATTTTTSSSSRSSVGGVSDNAAGGGGIRGTHDDNIDVDVDVNGSGGNGATGRGGEPQRVRQKQEDATTSPSSASASSQSGAGGNVTGPPQPQPQPQPQPLIVGGNKANSITAEIVINITTAASASTSSGSCQLIQLNELNSLSALDIDKNVQTQMQVPRAEPDLKLGGITGGHTGNHVDVDLSGNANLTHSTSETPPCSSTAPQGGSVKADSASVGCTHSLPDDVSLSEEQQRTLSLVLRGENVFFTGCAGTGKSVMIRVIIRELHKLGKIVGVTALTGIAAVQIGGITLHRWAGIKLARNATDLECAWSQKIVWRDTDALVIDEISMMPASLFHHLDVMGRQIRGNCDLPFGGLQLILSGDFYQLPPVFQSLHQMPSRIPPSHPSESSKTSFESDISGNTKGGIKRKRRPVDEYFEKVETFYRNKLCFQAITWQESVSNVIELTKVFRQKDKDFVQVLSEIRRGSPTSQSIATLQSRVGASTDPDILHLFAVNSCVDSWNAAKLQRLSGPLYSYHNVKYTSNNDRRLLRLLDSLLANAELNLKIGARVVLLKNIDGQLVNGSQGTVVAALDQTDPRCEKPPLSCPAQAWYDANREAKIPVVKFDGCSREICVLPTEWSVEISVSRFGK
ncbi:dna repair and recombination protein pif1 [Pelomyxa schiedti]|nr:dna repair and recombination protein pif1 [Pelomyxa schiedti]